MNLSFLELLLPSESGLPGVFPQLTHTFLSRAAVTSGLGKVQFSVGSHSTYHWAFSASIGMRGDLYFHAQGRLRKGQSSFRAKFFPKGPFCSHKNQLRTSLLQEAGDPSCTWLGRRSTVLLPLRALTSYTGICYPCEDFPAP